MATLDPGIIVADSDIATGDINAIPALLVASIDIAQESVALSEYLSSIYTAQQDVSLIACFAGDDLAITVDLGDLVVDRPLLSDSLTLADSSIDLQSALSLQDAQAFETAQAGGQELVTVTQVVELAAFNRRLNVLCEMQLVEPQDVVAIIPGTALDNFTYYLRGFNATTEEFEYWSSPGFADVSGAEHLMAVCVVGIV